MYISVHRNREIDHIEFEEFVNIIEEIKEAGWSPRVASPNEPISNIDLLHVFAKVDLNGDQKIDTRVFVIPYIEHMVWMFLQEMKQACKYLCKVFGFEKSTVRKAFFVTMHFSFDYHFLSALHFLFASHFSPASHFLFASHFFSPRTF